MSHPFLRAALINTFLMLNILANAQTYTVDLRKPLAPVISGQLQLGTDVYEGHSLEANSLYFIRDKSPWFPVMGEFHFSRYPRARWEESILKMKAAGVNVIATYVFWIYHEEERGKFDWSGDKDLRYFTELCKKNGVFLVLRIGPWCHGEVRNGGFPDWVQQMQGLRKNNPAYLKSVQLFYNAVGAQVKGLLFKDGGPIIGTQIENEYRFDHAEGLEHMLTLKRMAGNAGIDVPYYTATGWPGSDQKQAELIPVWGGYPEAPWDPKTTPLPLSPNYVFSTLRNDPAIGSDLLGKYKQDPSAYEGYRYPYATAEMGGGIEVTYHRRPLIEPMDVTAMAYVKISSGANLMGYYMFHGGHNAIGKFSTLQESKATGYPNDYPIVSYDFQAPVSEWGYLKPSYRPFKVLHSFLSNFGDSVATYGAFFPDRLPLGPGDSTTLRFGLRAKDSSGFVFINNYQRQLKLKKKEGLQFELKLKNNSSFTFPDKEISMSAGAQAILPFNMDLSGLLLKYATVQPLYHFRGKIPVYVFFAVGGIRPEYKFDKRNVLNIDGAALLESRDALLTKDLNPGLGSVITVKLRNGKEIKVMTLTAEQALDSWQGNVFGGDHLMISKQNLTFSGGGIKFESTGNNYFEILIFPAIKAVKSVIPIKQVIEGGVSKLSLAAAPRKNCKVIVKEISDVRKFQYTGKAFPADNRTAIPSAASPGAIYQTTLTPVKGAKNFVLNLTKQTAGQLLEIDYLGDMAAVYMDGKLYADDFYYGGKMQLKLPEWGMAKKAPQLVLQIVPLTDQRNIYFEKGVREKVRACGGAKLQSVKVIPDYKVSL